MSIFYGYVDGDIAVNEYGDCVMIERDDPLNPVPCFPSMEAAAAWYKRFVDWWENN